MTKIDFNPTKEAANLVKHQISLARAEDFEILAVEPDTRFDYGEERFRAWGRIDGEFYCLVFTTRENRVRAISLRLAHEKEIRRHVKQSDL